MMRPMTAGQDDSLLLAALRRGDEDAFGTLIDRYHASLVRIATLFVRDHGVAEEVAQETWIGVLKGLDRFEERSSFRTWLFSILTNQARRRGERERRVMPFSALARPADGEDTPAVDPERFIPPGEPFAGYWAMPPRELVDDPETVLLSAEARAAIDAAIAALPPSQQAVITLRDVEGWEADEVCNALGLTATNQRVLLHRARSRVRQALEPYLEASEDRPRDREREAG
jgi:RNA polymerase sigma-70 factor (ECF subfamily)